MKRLITGILICITIISISETVEAAVIPVLNPDIVRTQENNSFSIDIYLNAQEGSRGYTARMALNFPHDIIDFTSFTLSNKWVTFSQKGYDDTDNIKGIIVKTGGYPSGFTDRIKFGTVVFRAKEKGDRLLSIDPSSQVFDGSNANILVGIETAIARIEVSQKNAKPITRTIQSNEPQASAISPTTTPVPTLPLVANVSQGISKKAIGIIVVLGGIFIAMIALWFLRGRSIEKKQ